MSLTVGEDILFRINELGRLQNPTLDQMCTATETGPEFNPLDETDYYGRSNPF